MDSLLDALIGEELDSLGEELSAFLDPTCACGPVVPSARGSGQPTRKKRKKQRKRAQHAREDKQEEVPLSQEAGVIIFPAGSLDTGTEEQSPGQEQAGSEQEQETETETDTEPRFVRVPVDVVETRQGTHFAVDAPGIDRDAMKVEVAKRHLTISGVKVPDSLMLERDVKVKRKERQSGNFVRKFKLPTDAEPDRAYSTYNDGVLHVTVPKRPPPTPRKPDVITIPVTDRYSVQTPPSPGADARGTSDLESPTSVLPPAAGLGAVSSPGSFGKRATGQQETKGRESPKEPPRTIPVV